MIHLVQSENRELSAKEIFSKLGAQWKIADAAVGYRIDSFNRLLSFSVLSLYKATIQKPSDVEKVATYKGDKENWKKNKSSEKG